MRCVEIEYVTTNCTRVRQVGRGGASYSPREIFRFLPLRHTIATYLVQMDFSYIPYLVRRSYW